MHIYDLTVSVGQGSHLAGSPGSESLPRLQLHKAWLKEYTFKLTCMVVGRIKFLWSIKRRLSLLMSCWCRSLAVLVMEVYP